MATYNLELMRSFADRRIRNILVKTLFKRCPLLAFMALLGTNQINMDRPNALGLISGKKIAKAKREEVDGAVFTDVQLQIAKSGGGKTLLNRDTNPGVVRSQDQNIGSARFWWWFYAQPVEIWCHTLRLAGKGKYRIQNALTRSVDMAVTELVDTLATKIWTGAPSTYNVAANDDVYDDLPGVVEAMSTDNSYGNIDRSDATGFVDGVHPWASNRTTAAKAATLDLIDDANDVCQVYGDGVKLALTTRAVYRKLKKEALAKGGIIIHNGNVPGHGMCGYTNEFIQYGDCIIAFDPFCPTGYLACFSLEDWMVEVHPEEKGTADEFTRIRQPGSDDKLTSQINIGLRPYCEKPKTQFLFTNVTAG